MGKEENAEKRKTFYWLGVFAYLRYLKMFYSSEYRLTNSLMFVLSDVSSTPYKKGGHERRRAVFMHYFQ